MVNQPWLRQELIKTLYELADSKFQRDVWLGPYERNSGKPYADLSAILHFFYDDTELAKNPHQYIGLCLENQREANVLAQLITALDVAREQLGDSVLDEEFLMSSLWRSVVAAASHARQQLDS